MGEQAATLGSTPPPPFSCCPSQRGLQWPPRCPGDPLGMSYKEHILVSRLVATTSTPTPQRLEVKVILAHVGQGGQSRWQLGQGLPAHDRSAPPPQSRHQAW